MASMLQKAYWKAPYCLKNYMASWNSRKLERLRYGPDYQRVLAEIFERDKWSAEQMAEYQRERLCSLILHAAEHVPYYRRLFAETGVDPRSIQGLADLSRVPTLTKQTARAVPEELLDERLDRSRLDPAFTSGTSGTPMRLYRDEALYATLVAFFDGRCRELAGMRRIRNRSASIGGHLVAEPGRTRPPFWVVNRRWNQLYMSSYHLSPRNLPHYVQALRDFQPEYIEGYPSSVYSVAQFILENHLPPVPIKACVTTAETLFDHQRQAIREAFGCRTYNQYGCGEFAVFAAECEQGTMHLSPEVGITEIVDENRQPVPPGQVGRLVCTSLQNFVQPWIRYEVGDTGVMQGGQCPCGRPLPILSSLEGRVDAVLVTRDGRHIGRLDPVFKGANGIREAQIIQDDYDKFRVRLVVARDYTEQHGKNIVANLAQRVGQADIKVEIVEAIERTRAGKFVAVVCNVPKAAPK